MGCAQRGIIQGIDAGALRAGPADFRAEMDLICMRVYTYLLTQTAAPRK